MLKTLGIKQGKTFIVWTNNTATNGVVRKRKSGDKVVNKEWKKIKEVLVRIQVNIEARHVTSKGNRADALSRGEREGTKWKNVVSIVVPVDLDHLLFPFFYN